MADDALTVVIADGTTQTLRSKDVGGGKQAQAILVATMPPTTLGNETLAVGTGADTSLTPPGGATHALATVDPGGGGIRYWENGASPSSSVGLYVAPGGAVEFTNLASVRMRSTIGSVAVHVSHRKYAA